MPTRVRVRIRTDGTCMRCMHHVGAPIHVHVHVHVGGAYMYMYMYGIHVPDGTCTRNIGAPTGQCLVMVWFDCWREL